MIGSSAPLGATLRGGGVNFSVFSKHATSVQLLFFDRVDSARPSQVIDLDPRTERSYHYWHTFVPDITAGQIYAYRVDGPDDPERGRRFDRDKVLLDPYGKCVVRPRGWSRRAACAPGDNCASALKSVVADPGAYDWEGDRPLRTPFTRTVLYEMHVGAFTRHPNSGVAAGRPSGRDRQDSMRDLGITAVELLPVFFDDRTRRRPNDWVTTVSFFAPGARSKPGAPACSTSSATPRRSTAPASRSFSMSSTAPPPEAGVGGPTMCFRGTPTTHYIPGDSVRCADYSGCGNALAPTTRCPPAHSRQPALLGHRDARGRLSLRPGLDPVATRRPPDAHAAIPWDIGSGHCSPTSSSWRSVGRRRLYQVGSRRRQLKMERPVS